MTDIICPVFKATPPVSGSCPSLRQTVSHGLVTSVGYLPPCETASVCYVIATVTPPYRLLQEGGKGVRSRVCQSEPYSF